VKRGLMTKIHAVACDGDGWALEPERWCFGYGLTPLGVKALGAVDSDA